MGQPAKGVIPPLRGAEPAARRQQPRPSRCGTPSGSVPRHGGEEQLGVRALRWRGRRVPSSPPTAPCPWPIPAGLWAAEGLDDERAPPESQ